MAVRHLVRPILAVAAAMVAAAYLPGLLQRAGLAPGRPSAVLVTLLLEAAVWLALAWLGVRILDVTLARTRAPRLLRDLARFALFGLAAVAILAFVFDQSVTALVATSSVVIAVLGFALRNMIADIFSGIALNAEHPYRIGDWVELQPGTVGRVEEINWRATRLITNDGNAMIVPNGLVAGSRFLNLSQPLSRFRAALHVTLDPNVPSARVRRVLMTALLDARDILQDPRPDVVLDSLNEHGATYLARYWVPSYGEAVACRDAVTASVLRRLQEARLEPAAPRRDLVHRTDANRRDPRKDAHDDGLDGTLVPLMRRIDLFRAFSQDELEGLAASMVRHAVAGDSALVRQGETGSSLFLLAEGVLDVTTVEDGIDLRLDRLLPGDVFGEVSLLTGQPRAASVTTACDAVVYELTRDHVGPLLRRRPELAADLAELMAARLRHNADLRRSRDQCGAHAAPHATSQDLLRRVREFFGL
ncbi:MAG TPA: mechanosensitive ion channel family protein [Arenibaculum sp.]|nr:mechanosensitive ion channel family protein [Arenibaculum sp.]